MMILVGKSRKIKMAAENVQFSASTTIEWSPHTPNIQFLHFPLEKLSLSLWDNYKTRQISAPKQASSSYLNHVHCYS